MKKRVRIALAACLLIIPVLFSGCWDRVEINELAIIRAIAVDYLPGEKEPYLVTLVVIRPEEVVSGTEGGGAGSSPTRFFSGSGATLNMAVQKAGYSLSRRIFLPHNQLVLVGEEAARQGLFHITDFILRNNQLRLTNIILVVQGLAHEAVHTQERLENSVIEEILGMIDQVRFHGDTSPQETYKIIKQLASPGICPHTAVLRVAPSLEKTISGLEKELADNQEGGGNNGQGGGQSGELPDPEKTLIMDGLAVFCDDRLAGYLDVAETRGFMFLAGRNPRSVVMVTDPVNPREKVSLQITRSRTKIIPQVNDGRISFRVEVEEEGNLLSQATHDNLSSLEMLDKLASAKAGVIKAEMEKALRRLQQLQADIVGFGEQLNRSNPEVFRSLAKDWKKVFSEVDVEIHVTAYIRRTGQFSHPIKP